MFLDPSRTLYSRYFDWYEGDIRSLFTVVAPTVVNGIGLLGMQNISTTFNYLAALSRFYSAAVMGDLPYASNRLRRLLSRISEHWSVTGEAFLIRQDGALRTVRPDFVWPISNPYDREQIDQYLFIFPERKTQENDWLNEPMSSLRARVIQHDPNTGETFESVRDYSPGVIADTPRGNPVSPITVQWIRSGEPPYVSVQSIVREICVRLNMLQLALNTTNLPLIQLDKDTLADGRLRGQTPSLKTVSDLATEPLGLTTSPPFSGEEGARYIERSGTGLTESIEYVRMLLGQLGVLSGVPDYVFGVQLGRPNNETERVLFAGQARVNAARVEIEMAFEAMGEKVSFGADPFITRKERVTNVISQLTAGVISTAEARSILQFPGRVEGTLTTPTPSANGNVPTN